MIASVRGQVSHVGLDNVVIEVGGVGVLVHVTPATATSLRTGSTAYLATSLVVREDSLTLYGFADADGRSVFETVQTVTGVGPRLALAMLAVHSPDGVRAAVASGDLNALMKVPGIGRKGAERLVLELRDKMGMPSGPVGSPTAGSAGPDWVRQVREALVGLGWSAKQAEDTVEAITPEAGERPGVSGLLRMALQPLARSWAPMRGTPIGWPTPASRRGRTGPGRRPRGWSTPAGRTASDRSRRRCGPVGCPSSQAKPECATSSRWSWKPPGAAALLPTMSCSPGRPGWARRPWP